MSEAELIEHKVTWYQFAQSRVGLGSAIAVVAVTATALVLAVSGFSQADEEQQKVPPMPVKAFTAVVVDSVTIQRTYVGEIKARRSSDLSFERSAKLVKVLVDDGESVEQNQPLAVLDLSDLEINKEKAAAALEQANAVLTELENGPRQEVKDSAKAEVDALEAERALAERIRNRRSQLKDSTSISDEELEQAETRYAAAIARRDAAQKKLDELNAGTRKEKKKAQQALVRQLSAQLAEVKLQRTKSTLKAPFKGTVSRRWLDEGVVVAPGQPVLRVSENNRLEVTVGIAPSSIGKIRKGNIHQCVVDGENTQVTVRRILPETDEQTRMIPVVFELIGNFSPGQIARIQIKEKSSLSGVWVPTSALVPGARGMWSIYVAETGSDNFQYATMHTVNQLFVDGERSLVTGALDSGERIIEPLNDKTVIAEGPQRIAQGQRIKIVSEFSFGQRE